MSYTYSFFDNQTVGAYDLNNTTKLFMTKGIEDSFEDGVPYSITKLNDIVYSKGGAGVVPESNDTLKVTVADGVATINTGTAFFEDGTTITITEPEKLSIEGTGTHYVYLKSSVEENKAYPVISTIAPSGNVVPLAVISGDGQVSDKRCYAKGKLPSIYASDAGIAMKSTHIITQPQQEIILSETPHTYNYYLIRLSGGGQMGYEEPTNWATNTFINTENPGKSFHALIYTYAESYVETITGDINEPFTLLAASMGGNSPRIYGKFNTDNGIKLNLTSNYSTVGSIKDTYECYILPYKLEFFAF